MKSTKKRETKRANAVVRVLRLPHAEGLALPTYQSAAAAGMDLAAAVPADAPLMLAPGARALVPTGLVMALPDGYEAQVRPRSGLALRHGVTVLNSPGTIDGDYRGEVQILLINLGNAPWRAERGERIAQLVVQPVARVQVIEAVGLDETARGAGGFGSTGVQPRRPATASKAQRKPAAKRKAARSRSVRA